jgi:hypothetical protein
MFNRKIIDVICEPRHNNIFVYNFYCEISRFTKNVPASSFNIQYIRFSSLYITNGRRSCKLCLKLDLN